MLDEEVVDDVVAWAVKSGILTPCYLFSPAGVRTGVSQLRESLPGRISYVTKANAHPRMLRELEPLVDEFNVTNPMHLDTLLALGVDPSRVTFLNPVSTVETLSAVLAQGVTRFVVDDARGLRLLRRAGQTAGSLQLTLRLQPSEPAESERSVVRFGNSAPALRALARDAVDAGDRIEALSFFVGTARELRADGFPFRGAIEEVARLREQLERDGVPVPAVNIGGGFPGSRRRFHAAFPEFFPQIAKCLAQCLPADTDVVCEPGRFLSEPSMGILTRVVADREVAGRRLVYLDASAFGGLFETSFIDTGGTGLCIGYERRAAAPSAVDVLGPVMDSYDVVKRGALLPPLAEGDVLVLPNVGAYSWGYSTRCEGLGDLRIVDVPDHLDAGFAAAWYD